MLVQWVAEMPSTKEANALVEYAGVEPEHGFPLRDRRRQRTPVLIAGGRLVVRGCRAVRVSREPRRHRQGNATVARGGDPLGVEPTHLAARAVPRRPEQARPRSRTPRYRRGPGSPRRPRPRTRGFPPQYAGSPMVFSSFTFLFAFLPVTLAAYYLCPPRGRNAVPPAGSLFFYSWGAPRFVLVLAGGDVDRLDDQPRDRRGACGLAAAPVVAGRVPGPEPRPARLVQVRELRRRPDHARAGRRDGLPRRTVGGGRAAARHLLLHLPQDQLHRRRVPRRLGAGRRPSDLACSTSCSFRN